MDSIEALDISSPFEIDEKINEAIENTDDESLIDLYENKRIEIKDYLYDVNNWEIQDLYFLFDMDSYDDVIDEILFKRKVAPYLAQYDGSTDTGLSIFLNQAVNRLSMDRFQLTWDELNVGTENNNNDDENLSVKSTGIRIYSMQRNVLTDNIYDFVFQLNEPIPDVTSFTLVECTIPLSWFTFSENYRNNYFLVKIAENSDKASKNIINQNIRNASLDVNDDCAPKTNEDDDIDGSGIGIVDKVDYASYKTIKISDGNYTAEQLADELNFQIYQSYANDGIDGIGSGSGSDFKIFEYEQRTRRFKAYKKQGIRFHFVFYTGFQAEAGENTQINDCLGFAMGFLAPQHNVKFDSYDLDLQGDSDSFIRAPYIANTYGTPIINLSIDDFTNNQIGRSFIDGRPSEYNFDPVPENRIDYVNNEERRLVDRYSQAQAEARALQKSQQEILSMKSFSSNVSYSNVFASIPVTRSPCNTGVLEDTTSTMIHYKSNDLFSFKRYYSGATNISKLRVRLTNSLGKPLYLEQDYFIILKVNHLVRIPKTLI
jgi:hypothetical protein